MAAVWDEAGDESELGVEGVESVGAITTPFSILVFVLAWGWFPRKQKKIREKST